MAEDTDEDQQDDLVDAAETKCLLVFKAENNAPYRQTVRIELEPKIGADGKPAKLNFRCPRSPITVELSPNGQTTVLTVVKLDLSVEGWGEFSWSFRMVNKEYNAQAANFGNNNNYNNNNYAAYDAGYGDGWDDPPMQGSGDVGGSTAPASG